MDVDTIIKALEYCKNNQHANNCEECFYGGYTGTYCDRLIDDALALLKEQPDVVRCKDCKWWDKIGDSSYGYCHACKHCCSTEHWDIRIYREYKGDWFCADGEKRDESK